MKNAFQKIDIKDLVIVVGGSIDSSVEYGVGVVTPTQAFGGISVP